METRIFRMTEWAAEDDMLQEAATILQSGGLVVFPTETVYGLGANGLDAKAAARIFKAKDRPQDNPLILHVATPSELDLYCKDIPRQDVQSLRNQETPYENRLNDCH